jgi:hypothetical protein
MAVRVTISYDPTIPAPAIPEVDQFYLVGPRGNLVSELKADSASWVGPSQFVSVALNGVSQGAQLLVRIIENPAVVSQSPAPQPTSTGNVSFSMEVQRTEQTISKVSSAPLSLAGSVSNTVSFFLVGSGTSALALSSVNLALSSSSVDDLDPPVVEQAANSVNQAAARQSAEDFETEPLGVSVGPLVCRGSAPIGPVLATTPANSTQTIDRKERAYDLATGGQGTIARVDPELLDFKSTGLDGVTSPGMSEGRDSGLDPASQSLVTLRGPGGFPLIVTGLLGDRSRVDSSELLATLSTLDDPAESVGPLAEVSSELGPVEVLQADRVNAGEDPASTDFLTAACGLILGVSLTSGPLYPDLLALVRTWLPLRLRRGSQPLTVRSERNRRLSFLARWFARRPR